MKRKPRKEESKKDHNMMEPLDINKIGNENDPCFGRFHDPTTQECGMCGDSEICSIVKSQKLHLKRKLIEDKKEFKDIQNHTLTWKQLSRYLRKLLTKDPSTNNLSILKHKAIKKLNIHESDFDKVFKILISKSKKFTYNLKTNTLKLL